MNRENWLPVSLILNALLFGAVALLLARHSESGHSRTADIAPTQPAQSVPVVASAARGPESPAQETSLQKWLPQLRSIGLADPLLARVIAGDFETRWQATRLEMQHSRDRGDIDDIALAQFESQHDRERDNELRAALGETAFREWDKQNVVRQLPKELILSSGEADAVYQLKKRLTESQDATGDYVQNGEIDQGECDQMKAAAQHDYERKLRTLLGEERYAMVQSPEAKATGVFRRELRKLNLTSGQMTTALASQRQWDQRRADLDRQRQANAITDDAYEAGLQAAEAARDDAYRRALGASNYDQLQKLQNNQYQTMKRYATAWELSDGDIDYLYQTLQTYQKSLADYQRHAQLAEPQKQQMDSSTMRRNIHQLSQQTLETLRNYLGNERFNRLTQNDAFALDE